MAGKKWTVKQPDIPPQLLCFKKHLGQSNASVNNKHEEVTSVLIVKIKLLPKLFEEELRERENYHVKNSEAHSVLKCKS